MTKLEVGSEYWFKGRVIDHEDDDPQPYLVQFGDKNCKTNYVWASCDTEVSEAISEREKVTIPKEAADFIEECKPGYTLLSALEKIASTDKLRSWLLIKGNQEKFARAWLDGYEVEKEPLYWVRNKEGKSLLLRDHSAIVISGGAGMSHQENNIEDYTFTEKEIKNYDERYWAFRVEVTDD